MHRLALAALPVLLAAAAGAQVEDAIPGLALPEGEALARQINERPRAEHARRRVRLVLEPGPGERVREILSYWQLTPDARRLVMFALSPANWQGASFLSIDRFDAEAHDEQWLYRAGRGREKAWGPRRAARIPAARRSESFLGSDFTLEDVRKEDRVEVGEYRWRTLGRGEVEGRPVYRLEQVPRTPELARDLGFARAVTQVDTERLLRLEISFRDASDRELRVIRCERVGRVDGYWTALEIHAHQLHPPHTSVLVFDEIDTRSPLPEGIFSIRSLELERGLRLARRP